jgi:hypothetical protein
LACAICFAARCALILVVRLRGGQLSAKPGQGDPLGDPPLQLGNLLLERPPRLVHLDDPHVRLGDQCLALQGRVVEELDDLLLRVKDEDGGVALEVAEEDAEVHGREVGEAVGPAKGGVGEEAGSEGLVGARLEFRQEVAD